jgi:hypothetical protein
MPKMARAAWSTVVKVTRKVGEVATWVPSAVQSRLAWKVSRATDQEECGRLTDALLLSKLDADGAKEVYLRLLDRRELTQPSFDRGEGPITRPMPTTALSPTSDHLPTALPARPAVAELDPAR